MSDIERYLSELRAHLTDLEPKRADEIVAEARTHLESRAAQLRSSGLNEDEASAKAARTFGDSSQVAQDLIQGNAHHRRLVTVRAVGALALFLGSSLNLSLVLSSPLFVKRVVDGFVTPLTGLDTVQTAQAVNYAVMIPVALLTGVVAGRRFWWIAAIPAFLGASFFLLARTFFSPSVAETRWLIFFLVYLSRAFVHAAIFVGLGWLGAHLPPRRPAFVALKSLCATIAAMPWLGAAVVLVSSYAKVGQLHIMLLMAALLPLTVLFVLAARRDRWLSRQAFIGLVSTVCGLGLLSAIAVALVLAGEGPGALRLAQPWVTIAALTSALGLLGALIYWRRTQPDPTPGRTNPPPA